MASENEDIQINLRLSRSGGPQDVLDLKRANELRQRVEEISREYEDLLRYGDVSLSVDVTFAGPPTEAEISEASRRIADDEED